MTSTTVTPIPRGPRRMPAPQTEPPYDDEAAIAGRETAANVPAPAVQGTLALACPPHSGAPDGQAGTQLRLVPAPVRSTDPGRPDPRAWARQLAQAVTEVLAGDRPPTQLVRWTTERIYADLERAAANRARERTVIRSGRARPKVTRVFVCDVRDGVVEASAVVKHGARMRAMALRLETLGDQWLCTALEMP
jgi:hypothetical protein